MQGYASLVLRGHGGYLWYGLLVVVMAVMPVVVHSGYYLTLLIFVGLGTIVTVGLCLLMGYAGQISLGHAAFYGLGAYFSGILTTRTGLSPWLALLVAAVSTGIIAYLLGRLIFRLSGHYLAIATLGFGIIVYILFIELASVTGGSSGLTSIPSLAIGGLAFNTDRRFFYLVWAAAIIIMVLSRNIVHSRIGRALRAVHGSEVAAEMAGVDTARYKVLIFAVSALYASVAGSLYAHYITVINPSPFGFHYSIQLVVMVVIGGMASIWGSVFGAGAVIALTEILRNVIPRLVPGASGEYEIVFFGVIMVVVMIFLPEGLTTGSSNAYRRWRARRARRKGAAVDFA